MTRSRLRESIAVGLGIAGTVLFAGSAWLGLAFALSTPAWLAAAALGLGLLVAATRIAPGKGFRAVAPTDEHTTPRDPED